MATVKAANSRNTLSGVLAYVTQKEKTDVRLLTGIGCSPATARAEMELTKELWGKPDGRTYKHFVQSFHPDEKVTPEEAHRIACDLASKIEAWEGHEVLIATHTDKDHTHTHFIVNSVSAEDGRKLQWSKADLEAMKRESDELCREAGLTVCEKGRTFEGEERLTPSTYTKEAQQVMQKALWEGGDSYILDVHLAASEARNMARSREEFCELMQDRGIRVDWSDSRKHITFTAVAREAAGKKKCKIRNNKLEIHFGMDYTKQGLEAAFFANAILSLAEREEAARKARAAEQERFAKTQEPAKPAHEIRSAGEGLTPVQRGGQMAGVEWDDAIRATRSTNRAGEDIRQPAQRKRGRDRTDE